MCLIAIHKYTGENVAENVDFVKDIKTAIMNNPDGIGVMYADNGRLITDKQLFKTEEETLKYYLNKLDEAFLNMRDLVVHLRYTTKGDTSLDNVHPHKVFCKDDGDAIDLQMMHNGTISGVKAVATGKSDTVKFIDEVVKPALSSKPTLVRQKGFRDLLEFSIESFNKLVFMDSKGFINVVNPNAFTTKHGVSFSNTYSFNEDHRKPTTTYGNWGSGYSSSFKKSTKTDTKLIDDTTKPVKETKKVEEEYPAWYNTDDSWYNPSYYSDPTPAYSNKEYVKDLCSQYKLLSLEELQDEVFADPNNASECLKYLLTKV